MKFALSLLMLCLFGCSRHTPDSISKSDLATYLVCPRGSTACMKAEYVAFGNGGIVAFYHDGAWWDSRNHKIDPTKEPAAYSSLILPPE